MPGASPSAGELLTGMPGRLLFGSNLGETMTSRNVTRVDLCEAVYRNTRLNHAASSAMVELVLKEITDALEKGETVKLSAFGSFIVRKKKQRVGRNPKTGVEATISSRRIVVFKPSAMLKQQINGKRSGTASPGVAALGSSAPAR
jgi:integration host factor subunit alpha